MSLIDEINAEPSPMELAELSNKGYSTWNDYQDNWEARNRNGNRLAYFCPTCEVAGDGYNCWNCGKEQSAY